MAFVAAELYRAVTGQPRFSPRPLSLRNICPDTHRNNTLICSELSPCAKAGYGESLVPSGPEEPPPPPPSAAGEIRGAQGTNKTQHSSESEELGGQPLRESPAGQTLSQQTCYLNKESIWGSLLKSIYAQTPQEQAGRRQTSSTDSSETQGA